MAKKKRGVEIPEKIGNWGLTRNYINNMLSIWPVRNAQMAVDLGVLEMHAEKEGEHGRG
jgi:hypothetical protein